MSQNTPTPPPEPDYRDIYTSPEYDVHKYGACSDGTYIRSYVPKKPYRDTDGRLKAVVYLHGFCLGADDVYKSHLLHLVKQGYYVFFPTYQHGFCQYTGNLAATFVELAKALFCPYPISPQGWLDGAVASVIGAFVRAGLADTQLDTYVFGHSLGGLFALSWPYSLPPGVPNDFKPKQVIAADPVPDSQDLIPEPIRSIGELIHAFADRVNIKETGRALHVPVAILHGNSDTVVKAQAWVSYFYWIASTHKQFYCSQSDDHGRPALSADHVQATVDTRFLPDCIAQIFVGGVGRENTLDWRYIWYALDQVIRHGTRADQLQFDMSKWSDDRHVKQVLVGIRSLFEPQPEGATPTPVPGSAIASL